jgi:hypothetical protein
MGGIWDGITSYVHWCLGGATGGLTIGGMLLLFISAVAVLLVLMALIALLIRISGFGRDLGASFMGGVRSELKAQKKTEPPAPPAGA